MIEVNFLNPQINKIKNQEISIQVSLGGFSFCIRASDTQECLAFRAYTLKNVLLDDELIRNVEKLIESDTFLNGDFQSINYTFIHQGSTLIPEEYFETANLKKYYEFNQNLGEFDELHYTILKEIGIVNLFNVPSYLSGIIYKISPRARVTVSHQADRLIRFGDSHKNERQTLILVGINKGFFDLIVFEDGALTLSNSFQYANATDFIYFYLYALKQLKIDSSWQQPFVVGELCTDKTIIEALKQQSKSVEFPLTASSFGCANLTNLQINRFYNLFI